VLLLLMMMAAAFMFAAVQAPGQNENSDLPQQARSVVSALAAGQFSQVESRYNAAMKAAMPAGKLATAWNSLLEQAGEFKSIKNIDVEELPGLNHLFQTAKTGAIDEYPEIEETLAPVALEKIAGWVQKTTARP
jgi:metal-dependent amidase/aminoacylase/carboxypeptidase family protein